MGALNAFAQVVGWVVILLWLLGTMDLGDFVLRFGPHGMSATKAAATSLETRDV